MEKLQLRDFACISTRALGRIALELSGESDKNLAISPKLIDLAGRLHCVAEGLDQRSISTKIITRYLSDLEKLCTVRVDTPDRVKDMLKSIVESNRTNSEARAGQAISIPEAPCSL